VALTEDFKFVRVVVEQPLSTVFIIVERAEHFSLSMGFKRLHDFILLHVDSVNLGAHHLVQRENGWCETSASVWLDRSL
jgi:hypothetical protein